MSLGSATRSRLVALFFLGILLLNFPILSLASRELVVAGIPILFAYSFLSWGAIILLIALVAESKERGGSILKNGPGQVSETPREDERKSR